MRYTRISTYELTNGTFDELTGIEISSRSQPFYRHISSDARTERSTRSVSSFK